MKLLKRRASTVYMCVNVYLLKTRILIIKMLKNILKDIENYYL